MLNHTEPENLFIDINNPLEIFRLANELNISVPELLSTLKIVGLERKFVFRYLNAKLQPFLQLKKH